MLKDSTKTYNLYVELMRIVFTIYIIFMHSELYFGSVSRGRVFEGGYLGVDFFFIVSGYYVAQKAETKVSVREYLKSRFISLYPHYFFSFIIMMLILNENGFLTELRDLFWSMLMLQNLGLNINLYNGFLWYVTFLFWAGTLVYYFINRSNGKLLLYKLVAMYSVLFYAVYIYIYKTVDSISLINVVFPLSFYRSLAGLSLGAVIYKATRMRRGNNSEYCFGKGVLIAVLSFLALLVSLKKPHTVFDLLVILCFAICVYLSNTMTSKKQLSALGKVIVYMGRKCYPVYCYQLVAIFFVDGLLTNKNAFYVLLVSIAVAIFLDTIIYHIILKKFRWIKNCYQKNRQKISGSH